MASALDELLDAIVVAVGRRRLEVAQAKELIGELVLDAAGVVLDGKGDWREELLAAGLDPAVVERAYGELLGPAVPDDASVERRSEAAGEPIEMLLEHIKVLGDPAGWPMATTYSSLALAVIDSLWSIGVRYTGVRNVIARYRAFRSRAGVDADQDTPADLAAVIDGAGGPDAFAEIVANRQRTSSRNGILKAEAVRLAADVLIDAGISVPADVASATPEQLTDIREPLDRDPWAGIGAVVGILPDADRQSRESRQTGWSADSSLTRSTAMSRRSRRPTPTARDGGCRPPRTQREPARLRDLASPERQRSGIETPASTASAASRPPTTAVAGAAACHPSIPTSATSSSGKDQHGSSLVRAGVCRQSLSPSEIGSHWWQRQLRNPYPRFPTAHSLSSFGSGEQTLM